MKKVERIIFESENAEELFAIGQKYAASGNYPVAVEAFEKAYSLGHIRSLSTLGCLVASGRIAGHSRQYGIEMINEAVSKGDVKAKELLDIFA